MFCVFKIHPRYEKTILGLKQPVFGIDFFLSFLTDNYYFQVESMPHSFQIGPICVISAKITMF